MLGEPPGGGRLGLLGELRSFEVQEITTKKGSEIIQHRIVKS